MESRKLTETEQAILFWATFKDISDRQYIFRLIRSKDKEIKLQSLNTLTSRYFNRPEVCKYLEEVQTLKREWSRRGREEESQGERENVTETNKKRDQGARIDFADREQFISYLNNSINELSDEKQKTDYLKMLSDLLRFKESKPDKENEIQRFYTPLLCSDCPLYLSENESKK